MQCCTHAVHTDAHVATGMFVKRSAGFVTHLLMCHSPLWRQGLACQLLWTLASRLAPPFAPRHRRPTHHPMSTLWPSDHHLALQDSALLTQHLRGNQAGQAAATKGERWLRRGESSCRGSAKLLLISTHTVGLGLIVSLLPLQRLPCLDALAPLLRLSLQLLSLRRPNLQSLA